MIRPIVCLPEGFHKALEALYKEDIDDLRVGRERFDHYLANPEKTVAYASYRVKKLKR